MGKEEGVVIQDSVIDPFCDCALPIDLFIGSCHSSLKMSILLNVGIAPYLPIR